MLLTLVFGYSYSTLILSIINFLHSNNKLYLLSSLLSINFIVFDFMTFVYINMFTCFTFIIFFYDQIKEICHCQGYLKNINENFVIVKKYRDIVINSIKKNSYYDILLQIETLIISNCKFILEELIGHHNMTYINDKIKEYYLVYNDNNNKNDIPKLEDMAKFMMDMNNIMNVMSTMPNINKQQIVVNNKRNKKNKRN